MKYLYRKNKKQNVGLSLNAQEIEIFVPSLFGGLLLSGERRSIKNWAVRALFQISTLGKARVFYLRENGKLIHTSYVIPRCFKFSYLGEEDYQIGPCYTYPEYRGKGYYPKMLGYICEKIGTDKTVFYMTVDESNHPSIKGIEKAGFKRCGNIKTTKLLKRYLWNREQKN